MKTIFAALPVSSSRSVVECKEKLHERCCHWHYRCFAFASSSCVAMAQSKRKCVFVAKFHTSSLSQWNDAFMLAVKHDWKAFATAKSRVVNFETTFWSPLALRSGSRGYLRTECCTGGRSAKCMNTKMTEILSDKQVLITFLAEKMSIKFLSIAVLAML